MLLDNDDEGWFFWDRRNDRRLTAEQAEDALYGILRDPNSTRDDLLDALARLHDDIAFLLTLRPGDDVLARKVAHDVVTRYYDEVQL